MGSIFYSQHLALTPAVVKLNILTLESNEHTYKIDNSLSVKFSGQD